MRKDQLKIGNHYRAEHKGRPVTVRLDAIRDAGNGRIAYDATVYPSGDLVTWGNAGKFLKEVLALKPPGRPPPGDQGAVRGRPTADGRGPHCPQVGHRTG